MFSPDLIYPDIKTSTLTLGSVIFMDESDAVNITTLQDVFWVSF